MGLSGSSLRHDFRLRWIITGLGITAEYVLATTGPADETVCTVNRGGQNLAAGFWATSERPNQVFATSQRRIRSATCVAVASGTLEEYFPSLLIQNRRPVGCRISSIRYVFPPRFFKLIRMSAGSLGTLLTLRMLQIVPGW